MSRQPQELLLILQAWCDPDRPNALQEDFDPSREIPHFVQLLKKSASGSSKRYVNSLVKHHYQGTGANVYDLRGVWFVIQCFTLLDLVNKHRRLCESQDMDFAGGQQLIDRSYITLCEWLSHDPMCWQLCRFAQCFPREGDAPLPVFSTTGGISQAFFIRFNINPRRILQTACSFVGEKLNEMRKRQTQIQTQCFLSFGLPI